MLSYETSLRVRYAETDCMGIVHHSNYAIWLEVGRTDLFKSIGFSYVEFEERGAMLPLINLKCNFKYPAKYDNEINIKTFISEMSKTRICFSYEISLKNEGKILCIAETEHVFTDKGLKPMNLKKVLPQYYEAFTKFAQKEG